MTLPKVCDAALVALIEVGCPLHSDGLCSPPAPNPNERHAHAVSGGRQPPNRARGLRKCNKETGPLFFRKPGQRASEAAWEQPTRLSRCLYSGDACQKHVALCLEGGILGLGH